jgi:glycine/D-amino acid oxidase-like deaminating enzyme
VNDRREIPRTADVAVIGGGIVGCSAAYYLAKAGFDTVLLDQQGLCRDASGATAGNIHLQLQRNVDGPTVWTLDAIPAREMEVIRARSNLHVAAANIWAGLETEMGRDLGLKRPGGLMVAETPQEFAYLKLKAKLENALGINTEVLTFREARELEPGLSEDLTGAVWCKEDGFADPLRVAPAFGSAILEAGGRIETWTCVEAIDREASGSYKVRTNHGALVARYVVNAAGAGGAQVSEMVGTHLPVTYSLLQVCVTERTEPVMRRFILHVTRRLTMKQLPVGSVLISGGWLGDPGPQDRRGRVALDSVRGNVWAAQRVIPAVGRLRLLRAWVGNSAYSEKHDLFIGEDPGNKGFFCLIPLAGGFTLGPLLGRLLTEVMTGREPSMPISEFLMSNL